MTDYYTDTVAQPLMKLRQIENDNEALRLRVKQLEAALDTQPLQIENDSETLRLRIEQLEAALEDIRTLNRYDNDIDVAILVARKALSND